MALKPLFEPQIVKFKIINLEDLARNTSSIKCIAYQAKTLLVSNFQRGKRERIIRENFLRQASKKDETSNSIR